jgi:hypothetical protein
MNNAPYANSLSGHTQWLNIHELRLSMHGNRHVDRLPRHINMFPRHINRLPRHVNKSPDMLTCPIDMVNIQDHALFGYTKWLTRQCKSIKTWPQALKHTLLMICRHGINIFSVSLDTAKVFHIILIG